MTVIGALSSLREPGEMSPHKRYLFTRSKARNQERLTCLGGAGATAPNCCNCASVNSPFRMSTWPAGVVARRTCGTQRVLALRPSVLTQPWAAY